MASSSPLVSQEEFKTFHNIDRMLYTRLVVNLERDTAESMQVMGLWLWLERSGHVRDLVGKLLPLPDSFIDSMAKEALLCLECIQNEHFLHKLIPINIPLLESASRTGLSLRFFHENRASILRSVSKIVNEVCLRAFDDISAQVETLKAVLVVKGKVPFSNNLYGHNNVLPLVYGNNYIGGSSSDGSSSSSQYGGGHFGNFMHGYDIDLQKQILSNEIGDMLSRIQICTGGDQEEKDGGGGVPADDRTIFLTFSKGYPILEQEIRDFFSRRYGECIEAIYMQEVTLEEHQPLYARLVVRLPAMIRIILEGNTKAKFSINGKHVWARKYVRKNHKSPPRSSSPPTSPTTTQ